MHTPKQYFEKNMSVIKKFGLWFGLKEKVHARVHRPPFVSQGDIWWAHVGENIGSEISGKSEYFSRPVIILKKLSHGFYFVMPTSTQDKIGTWFVPFKHRGISMVACLHQARAIDYRRIISKLGTLDDEDEKRIKIAFLELYK